MLPKFIQLKNLYFCLVRFLICAVLLTNMFYAYGAIEIKGKLTKIYNTDSSAQKITKRNDALIYEFTVIRKEEQWFYEIIDLNHKNGNSYERTKVAFDGEDLFRIYHFAERQDVDDFKGIDVPPEYGIVENKSFPSDGKPIEKLVWLAFLSDGFFKENNDSRIPTLSRIGKLPNLGTDGKMHFNVKYINNVSNLLPQEFLAYELQQIISFKSSRLVAEKYPKPFDGEMLKMDYKISTPTNFYSQVFPVEFICDYYSIINLGNNIYTNAVNYMVNGVVESMELTEIGDIRPVFQSEAIVEEKRFLNTHGLVKLLQKPEEGWVNRSEQSEIVNRKRVKKYHGERSLKKTNVENLLRAAIIITLIIPLFFLAKELLKTKNKKQKL